MRIRSPWRATEPWEPTPRQEEAALRLAGPDGGIVRTNPDASAELRTTARGRLRRYVLYEDGSAQLVESTPATWRYWMSEGAGVFSGLCLVAAIAFAVYGELAGHYERWETFALGAFGLCMLCFLVGLFLTPFPKTPPGERWTKLGGPEE